MRYHITICLAMILVWSCKPEDPASSPNSVIINLNDLGPGTEEGVLELNSGRGTYRLETLDPISGKMDDLDVTANNGILKITTRIPEGEIALKITRIEQR